jgi:hypothetical protein
MLEMRIDTGRTSEGVGAGMAEEDKEVSEFKISDHALGSIGIFGGRIVTFVPKSGSVSV